MIIYVMARHEHNPFHDSRNYILIFLTLVCYDYYIESDKRNSLYYFNIIFKFAIIYTN